MTTTQSEANGSPTEALRILVNSRFNDFLTVEANPNITSAEKVAVALFRSIFSHNPRSIRTAINRLDGLLPKQVDLILPKVFYLYPNAKEKPLTELTQTQDIVVLSNKEEQDTPQQSKNIPELSVREATRELSQLPFSLAESIIKDAAKTAKWVAGEGKQPKHIPYVKSILAAHLVIMASKAMPDVVEDFFDSIDGRLAETIKIGEDIYLTSYAAEAPEGAVLNEQGILMIEATKQQDMWGKALQKGKIFANE